MTHLIHSDKTVGQAFLASVKQNFRGIFFFPFLFFYLLSTSRDGNKSYIYQFMKKIFRIRPMLDFPALIFNETSKVE